MGIFGRRRNEDRKKQKAKAVEAKAARKQSVLEQAQALAEKHVADLAAKSPEPGQGSMQKPKPNGNQKPKPNSNKDR